MSENKILQYLKDTAYFLRHQDKEGLRALREESREEYVSLDDVGRAFIQLVDELGEYVDASQAITEVRMKAIVEELPKETQMKIHASFIEADDDLFVEDNNEGEEKDNE